MTKAPKIIKRYNKDGSVSYIARGRVVLKVSTITQMQGVPAFLTGWFGTDDRSKWNMNSPRTA